MIADLNGRKIFIDGSMAYDIEDINFQYNEACSKANELSEAVEVATGVRDEAQANLDNATALLDENAAKIIKLKEILDKMTQSQAPSKNGEINDEIIIEDGESELTMDHEYSESEIIKPSKIAIKKLL